MSKADFRSRFVTPPLLSPSAFSPSGHEFDKSKVELKIPVRSADRVQDFPFHDSVESSVFDESLSSLDSVSSDTTHTFECDEQSIQTFKLSIHEAEENHVNYKTNGRLPQKHETSNNDDVAMIDSTHSVHRDSTRETAKVGSMTLSPTAISPSNERRLLTRCTTPKFHPRDDISTEKSELLQCNTSSFEGQLLTDETPQCQAPKENTASAKDTSKSSDATFRRPRLKPQFSKLGDPTHPIFVPKPGQHSSIKKYVEGPACKLKGTSTGRERVRMVARHSTPHFLPREEIQKGVAAARASSPRRGRRPSPAKNKHVEKVSKIEKAEDKICADDPTEEPTETECEDDTNPFCKPFTVNGVDTPTIEDHKVENDEEETMVVSMKLPEVQANQTLPSTSPVAKRSDFSARRRTAAFKPGQGRDIRDESLIVRKDTTAVAEPNKYITETVDKDTDGIISQLSVQPGSKVGRRLSTPLVTDRDIDDNNNHGCEHNVAQRRGSMPFMRIRVFEQPTTVTTTTTVTKAPKSELTQSRFRSATRTSAAYRPGQRPSLTSSERLKETKIDLRSYDSKQTEKINSSPKQPRIHKTVTVETRMAKVYVPTIEYVPAPQGCTNC